MVMSVNTKNSLGDKEFFAGYYLGESIQTLGSDEELEDFTEP